MRPIFIVGSGRSGTNLLEKLWRNAWESIIFMSSAIFGVGSALNGAVVPILKGEPINT